MLLIRPGVWETSSSPSRYTSSNPPRKVTRNVSRSPAESLAETTKGADDASRPPAQGSVGTLVLAPSATGAGPVTPGSNWTGMEVSWGHSDSKYRCSKGSSCRSRARVRRSDRFSNAPALPKRRLVVSFLRRLRNHMMLLPRSRPASPPRKPLGTAPAWTRGPVSVCHGASVRANRTEQAVCIICGRWECQQSCGKYSGPERCAECLRFSKWGT